MRTHNALCILLALLAPVAAALALALMRPPTIDTHISTNLNAPIVTCELKGTTITTAVRFPDECSEIVFMGQPLTNNHLYTFEVTR